MRRSRHPDWQGNITMVTDATGKVEQHTGYYPYGEPWSEPSGQPWLYGGKERMRRQPPQLHRPNREMVRSSSRQSR